MSIEAKLDKLDGGTDRRALRRKANALFDLFKVDGFQRGLVSSRLEKGLREATDEQIRQALRILRE